MSCDNPAAIYAKMDYVKGDNPLLSMNGKKKTALGGVSFWSLSQDLPYSNSHSLLKAVNDGLNN